MKKIKSESTRWIRMALFFGIGIFCGLVVLVGVARLTWHGKFYPGVTVGNVEIEGMSREQVKERLLIETKKYTPIFSYNGYAWTAPAGSINFEIEASLNAAYRYGRRLKIGDYLLLLINRRVNFPLVLSEGTTETMAQFVSTIASNVEIDPVESTVSLQKGNVVVVNGSDGIVINTTKLGEVSRLAYNNLSLEKIEVPTEIIATRLDNEKIEILKQRAENLKIKKLVLSLDDEKIELDGEKLIALLATDGGESVASITKVNEYSEGLKKAQDKEPQDAKFEIAEGKVKEFTPGKEGVEVDLKLTTTNILTGIEALINGEGKNESINIAVNRTAPKVTTDKVNELGIKERIGRGESYYQHSIPNRIYNVALASTRLNSALIGPGEEISFNNLVGEVSGATGYRPAYIISGGRTILGDGGGLCQVSTTMFRAAMNGGLPILERWGHAYRVSYYELNSKPGVDATVIAPSKDFRFKNDTPGHILIQTINDPKTLHLVIEIYGTSDGRVATVSEPKVWGISPARPTIYQDDPSLPAGVMKQVDWATPGAKASFEYKVVRNGETLSEKTFTTNYQPWASVYLKGTGQ